MVDKEKNEIPKYITEFNQIKSLCVEVLPNRLYWFSANRVLKENSIQGCHVYNMDHKYVYRNFNKDFGPLNLSHLTQYILDMRRLVRENNMAGGRDPTSKIVIHHCSALSMYQANSCVLLGAYAIFDMGFTAEEAYKLFAKKKARLAPFQDSGKVPTGFGVQVNDCLKALERARNSRWYNPSTFDWRHYEKMS